MNTLEILSLIATALFALTLIAMALHTRHCIKRDIEREKEE